MGWVGHRPSDTTSVGEDRSLPPGDGRSAEARRWKRTYEAIVEDFTLDMHGTPDRSVLRLIRRATTLTVESDKMDALAAGGLSIDTGELVRLNGALSRAMRSLGLEPNVGGDGKSRRGEEETLDQMFNIEPLPGESEAEFLGRVDSDDARVYKDRQAADRDDD